MKTVRRRLGIVVIAVVLTCLSVSLGTWVVKRQVEVADVGWSPLFESRVERALMPLKTTEVMADAAPTDTREDCTSDCTPATSDCPDTSDNCEETLAGADCEETEETVAAAVCDTIDITCANCDSWDEPCDGNTFAIAACSTWDATCYENYPDCVETVDFTCDADDPDCKETVDFTCDPALWPRCVETVDYTCDAEFRLCMETLSFSCFPTLEMDCFPTVFCFPTVDAGCFPTLDPDCAPNTCFCFPTLDVGCFPTLDPDCIPDTWDATCDGDDPHCAELTFDCPDTWDCKETLDCPEEEAMDFGDAPYPSHHTRLADDGARHIVNDVHYLGLRIDDEPDGQPTPPATGDDIPARKDDEDGVWFTTSLFPGRKVSLIVEASTDGYLDAWIDGDADGAWSGAGEQIFVAQPLSEGFNVVSFKVPTIAVEGPAFSRFRFSSLGFLSYRGRASDGEVEDHFILITKAFGAAIRTDKMNYTLGEDATVKFYVNEAAEVRLVEDRAAGEAQVLWSGTVDPGTHQLRQAPITEQVGRGTVVLLATSLVGSTTTVSTPFDVVQP